MSVRTRAVASFLIHMQRPCSLVRSTEQLYNTRYKFEYIFLGTQYIELGESVKKP